MDRFKDSLPLAAFQTTDLLAELAQRSTGMEMPATVAALLAIYNRGDDPDAALEAIDAAGKELRVMWLEVEGRARAFRLPDVAQEWRTA